MKLKTILLLIGFLLGNRILYAQIATGKLIDINKTPIEYANVLLYHKDSTTFIEGTVTDNVGAFVLKSKIRYNEYYIKFSCLGYKDSIIQYTETFPNVIVLESQTFDMNEIVVTANRRIISKKDGGINVDVEKSYLSAIGNANDVLSHLPLIIENNNNIQVIGKGEPVIYVDNRKIRDKNELLKLSSTEIKKVDIITNPGSEYSSNTKSVIKIHTNRPYGYRYSYNVHSYIAVRESLSEYMKVGMNSQRGNLNSYIDVSVLNNKGDYERNTTYMTSNFDENYIGDVETHRLNADITGGVNYDWKQNSIGFRYEYTNTPLNKENKCLNVFADELKYKTKDYNNSNSYNHYINTYYNHYLADNIKVELDIDFNKGGHKSHTKIDEEIKYNPIEYKDRENYELFATRLKVSHKYSIMDLYYGIDYYKTSLDGSQIILEHNSESDLLGFQKENIQNSVGTFVNLKKSWKSLSVTAGIRYEYLDFKYFENDRRKEEQSKVYNSLLPYLMIGYSMKNIQFELSCKKYLEHPSYKNLSNVTTYTSVNTRWKGNPYLEPCEIVDLNLNLLYKEKLYVSSGIEFIKDQIFEINTNSDKNHDILIVRPDNLPGYSSYYLDVSYGMDCGIWHPTLNVCLQFQNLSYGIPSLKYNKPLGEFAIDNRFSFNKDWNIWLTIGHRTKGNYATAYTKGYTNVGMTISKSFFKKSLMLKLECKDILNKGREKIDITTNGLSMIDSSVGNTRCLKFSLTYYMNKSSIKYKGNKISQNEFNRLKK